MISLLRTGMLAGIKRDIFIKESLQQQLNASVIEMQGFVEGQEKPQVENCEEANMLCFIIEALFLHGLKDTLLNRVTEALSGPDFDAMPQPSFWGPLLVLSHRQIIDQIQGLTQITTEVGYCRAWIRLALNDGLLSSYFASIRRDNSVLKPYYNRSAFLRDPDLAHVAQRLIESIDHIPFHLACNTSLLNIWSNTPLHMAAIWSPTLKSCPVSSAVDIAKTINSERTLTDNFDEIESVSSIGSLDSLNKFSITSKDEMRKIKLGKEKRFRSGVETSNTTVQTKETSEKASEEEEQEKEQEEEQQVVVRRKIENGITLDSGIDTERENGSREDLREEEAAVEPELANDAAATGGNSLIGRLGWSTSIEDFESSLTTSAISGSSDVDAPHTPADARPYDALIRSYNKGACYAATADSSEFPNNCLSRVSQQDNSGVKPKSLEEAKEADLQSFNQQLGKLSREKGLDTQNYSCMSCDHPIGMSFSKAWVCGFTGEYYCTNCMAEEEFLIPSRVIHNWDLKRYPVSQKAARYLNDCPVLLDLKVINPRIYMVVDDIAQLQSLRIQLNLLRAYLFTCREPVIESLQKKVAPRDYLYEHVHQYSVSDLADIPNGIMAQQLQKVVEFARNHVTNCWLCSQKGFICEVCDNPKVIYPFDMSSTYRCAACNAVFHIDCMNASHPCPKCERRRKRMDLPLLDLGSTDMQTVSETPGIMASS
ncbi:uncharacterized protein Plekhm1 [Neodiprion pinetum]|uniref:uncharacterized protein Plekhm1 n=1 Tax=Neodiprion pinetum TaxID=441929 RepID=UPI00076FD9CA|nr:uncharacterized protein LOC124219277 isoform X1 [Neodiprion pinetum]